MSTGEVVELNPLLVDPGPRVRVDGLNLDHVAALREVADDLPPVTVVKTGERWRVVDGNHRREAAALASRPLRAVVVEMSAADAEDFAWRANGQHGLPYSLADRRRRVRSLLDSHPDWSDRQIAADAGVTHKVVAALRPTGPRGQLDGKRQGADGKSRPGSKSEQHAQRDRIAGLLAEHPDWSLHRVAQEVGASAMTVASVRTQITQGSPAADRGGEAPVEIDRDPSPGADQGEGGEAPPARHLAPVPDRTGEEPTPALGDLIEWYPTPGQWVGDASFQTSNAARDFARLMDRRMFRDVEAEDIAGCCPADRRRNAAYAARRMADAWAALADELEAPIRPATAEA